MANNKSLAAANKAKNDEFYTQLSDIENELRHYKPWSLGGKTDDDNCVMLCRDCNREKSNK